MDVVDDDAWNPKGKDDGHHGDDGHRGGRRKKKEALHYAGEISYTEREDRRRRAIEDEARRRAETGDWRDDDGDGDGGGRPPRVDYVAKTREEEEA